MFWIISSTRDSMRLISAIFVVGRTGFATHWRRVVRGVGLEAVVFMLCIELWRVDVDRGWAVCVMGVLSQPVVQ